MLVQTTLSKCTYSSAPDLCSALSVTGMCNTFNTFSATGVCVVHLVQLHSAMKAEKTLIYYYIKKNFKKKKIIIIIIFSFFSKTSINFFFKFFSSTRSILRTS